MQIDALTQDLSPYIERLRAARESVATPIVWYRYDTLANLIFLDRLLEGEHRDLDALAMGRPVADVGAADGDLGFTLEQALGWQIDIVDNAPTNQNRLPRGQHGLVLLLGILYHLKNPFYVLEEIAKHARHCVLSARVTRLAGPERSAVGHMPMAYLVGPTELNNDPTNFWIFTPPGLERLAERGGWEVVSRLNVSETTHSVPDSIEGDERMLLLLPSRRGPDL